MNYLNKRVQIGKEGGDREVGKEVRLPLHTPPGDPAAWDLLRPVWDLPAPGVWLAVLGVYVQGAGVPKAKEHHFC